MRNFGFFLYIADGFVGVNGGPDNYPTSAGLQPAGHDLAGVTDIDYRRFDLDYPDSDAPSIYYKQTGDKNCLFAHTKYGKYDSPSRFSEWNREFQMMLAKDPSGAAVPAYMQIRLPTDHTEAARSGKHTPRSYNADNDYGLGQIVEAVSHSPIWKSTAICVIEDDAQSGADHVDCHRTLAYIISPWIKAHSVDHHFYNTDSMLKTIELVLGLKPLCQYDAVADPIMDWDTQPANADAVHCHSAAERRDRGNESESARAEPRRSAAAHGFAIQRDGFRASRRAAGAGGQRDCVAHGERRGFSTPRAARNVERRR